MRLYLCFAVLVIAFIVLNDQFQAGTALRKRKIFKKLRDLLPLLLALKGKRKLFVLPVPIPIKVTKEAKQSWPSIPSVAWPAPAQQSWQSPPISWPSIPIPESYIQEAIASWPAPSARPQSSPPTKITHSQSAPEYISDNSGFKKSIEQFLTTYEVKDVPVIPYPSPIKNGYNTEAVSSAYNGGQSNYISNSYFKNPPSYGRNRDLDARKPLVNKSTANKRPPLFGQPVDEYENGKGSAAVYNDDLPKNKDNRVQFQKSVSGDYAGGSNVGQSNSNNNINNSNEYRSKNEINYENNFVKSVSGDYSGSSGGSSVVDNNEVINDTNNEANNGYDENSEINNEDVSKDADQTYVPNSVPAIRKKLKF